MTVSKIEMSHWSLAASSVTGFGHAQREMPCEDHFAVWTSDYRLCVVVADGAGSAIFGERGADILTTRLKELIVSNWPAEILEERNIMGARTFVRNCIAQIRDEIVARSESGVTNLHDFGSTLMCVVASQEGGFLAHIGDGAIAVVQRKGVAITEAISPPENGEYANETFFFTSSDWDVHLRVTPIEMPLYVLVTTDGAEEFAFETGFTSLSRRFFDPLTRAMEGRLANERNKFLYDLLDREDVRSRNGDDKTIVWAGLNV